MLRKGEIRSLTGLRGVAACFVVIYHFTDGGYGLPSRPLQAFISHGYLSVDLFFVLSGFVMALNYGSRLRPDRVRLQSYGHFIGSRLGRVYPLYLVATLICVACAQIGLPEFAPAPDGVVAANVLLVQAWGLADTICGPAWSISTELAAYLLLPALLWFTMGEGSSRPAAAMCAIVASYVLLTRLGTSSGKHGPLDVYSTDDGGDMLRCIVGFLFGLLCHRAVQHPVIWEFFRKPVVGLAIAAAVIGGMMIPDADLVIVLLFGPLVISLAAEVGIVSRLLSTPSVFWLGVVSYSIYLVHFPLGRVGRPIIKPYLGSLERFHVSGVGLFLATLVIAGLTYHLIEFPARRLTRRWLGRRPDPVEAVMVAK